MWCESFACLRNILFPSVLVALSHLTLPHSVLAGPIPQLDLAAGESRAAVSVDSLGIAARGEAGRAEMEDAVRCFREGNVDRAVAYLESAADANPRLPPPTVMLARMFLATGDVARGRQWLEQAAVVYADSADVYLLFGELALAEGRVTAAALQFKKAKSLLTEHSSPAGPEPDDAWLGLAAVAELRQKWADAECWLSKVLELDAENPSILQRLAKAQFEQQRFEDAEATLRAARELDARRRPASLLLARWHYVVGRAAEAEHWLRRALNEAPDDRRVVAAALLWCLEIGRVDEAQRHADRLGTLHPDSPDTLRLQGLVATFENDFVTAERCFQNLLTQNPADFAASNQLALALIEQEDDDKRRRARQLAEMNVRQYPGAAEALATLGWIYYRQGRTEHAERMLQPVIDSDQKSPDTAYYLARVLTDRGRNETARQILEQAIDAPGAFRHREACRKLLASLSAPPPQTAEESP